VRAPLLLLALASTATAAPRAWVELPDTPAHRALLEPFDAGLDGPTGDRLRFDVATENLDALRLAAPALRVLASDASVLRPAAGERGLGYLTFDQLQASWEALEQQHPDLVRLVEIGRSLGDRPITAVLVTDRPWEQELDEPSMRVLGTHHGDEWSSTVVTTSLLTELIDRAAADEPAARALTDGWQIWFVPVVNPDGYEAFSRRNDRGVDLNRNYAEQWVAGGSAGTAPFSEPETRAIAGLSSLRHPAWSLTVHSGETNLGWPWNYTLDPHVDGPLMEEAALAYEPGQPGFWWTQGSGWFVSRGDTNDWSLGAYGGHDFTLEVSVEKSPPEEELPDLVAFHVDPSLAFLLAAADSALTGRIEAPEDRVHATVQTERRSPVRVDAETGAFGFPTEPGPQTLTAGGAEFAVTAPEALTLLGPAPPRLDRAEGLQQRSGAPRTVRVCGPDAGEVALLDGDAVQPLSTEFDGDCAAASLPNLPPGEFSLQIGAAVLPLAVQVGEANSPWDLQLVRTPPPRRGAPWTLSVPGGPRGGELRLVGPAGQRIRPEHVPAEVPTVLVSARDLAEGTWALRVVGGQQDFVDPAFDVLDGTLVDPPKPPLDDPGDDDDGNDDDDDDAGTACTCGSPNAVALLAPLLPMGYARRRRHPCAA